MEGFYHVVLFGVGHLVEERKNQSGLGDEVGAGQRSLALSERYGSSRWMAMIARRVEILFSNSSCMIASRRIAASPIRRTIYD